MGTIEKKIVVLGDTGVGKTAIVQRYVNGTFTDEYRATSGAMPMKKSVEYEGNTVKLVIWDVAGHLIDFHHAYSSGADGVILVCDMTKLNTPEAMRAWLTAITSRIDNVPIVVAANKSDLPGSKSCADKLAKEMIITYTSAKTGENVDKLFMALIALI